MWDWPNRAIYLSRGEESSGRVLLRYGARKIFPLSLSLAVQIYWTVLNKSSQVTENTRSVSAVEKLSIIPDSLSIKKKNTLVPANRKDIM